VNGTPPAEVFSHFPQHQRIHVDVQDSEDTFILKHFEDTTKFIENAIELEGGRILVACAQGVSRSVAIVMAYVMWKHRIPSDQALEMLRTAHPGSDPNEGFLQQSQLWYDMSFQCDAENASFRSLCAKEVIQRVQEEGATFDMESLAEPTTAVLDSSSSSSSKVYYRCRSCRILIASWKNIMAGVSVGRGGEEFSWKKRSKDAKLAQHSASEEQTGTSTSIFVEPLRWMKGITEENQGKLYCPNRAYVFLLLVHALVTQSRCVD